MIKRPSLELQTTTFWEYPSQHYGSGLQGDKNYLGASPSWVIWNLIKRYTKENELVLDPMCGSGTTIDVAHDLNRQGRGFDIAPIRDDIEEADARKLPLKNNSIDFIFIDPPYSTHIRYSGHPKCIGELDAYENNYFQAMEKVIQEIARVLKPEKFCALYISDSFKKGKGFLPLGFRMYDLMSQWMEPQDIIVVKRQNKKLREKNFHTVAEKDNFYLRGFNYLLIFKKKK